MIVPPVPPNEQQRSATLRATQLLDSPPEERFDRVTRFARRLFNVPTALVTLIDRNRQWFKSKQGFEDCETSRDVSFCGHAILGDELLVVEDALLDARFSDNPLVAATPGVRFYAGYPLAAPDGSKLGTLCILSDEPRAFSAEDQTFLHALATMIEAELGGVDRATTDIATGLANLRGFLEIGDYMLKLVARSKGSRELLLLKVTRDESGPVANAEAHDPLPVVVRQVLACFGDSDLVARIGPLTFALLLPSQAGSTGTASRLEQLARSLESEAAPIGPLRLESSCIPHDPARHASLEVLLAVAEQDMKGRHLTQDLP